jgi:hypothetical protein
MEGIHLSARWFDLLMHLEEDSSTLPQEITGRCWRSFCCERCGCLCGVAKYGKYQ